MGWNDTTSKMHRLLVSVCAYVKMLPVYWRTSALPATPCHALWLLFHAPYMPRIIGKSGYNFAACRQTTTHAFMLDTHIYKACLTLAFNCFSPFAWLSPLTAAQRDEIICSNCCTEPSWAWAWAWAWAELGGIGAAYREQIRLMHTSNAGANYTNCMRVHAGLASTRQWMLQHMQQIRGTFLLLYSITLASTWKKHTYTQRET